MDPEDWATPSTNELVRRALNPIYKGEGNIILLHDAGGNRTHTVEALPIIIKDLKKHGYSFVTISDLMNKERDEIMPPVSSEGSNIYFTIKLSFQEPDILSIY